MTVAGTLARTLDSSLWLPWRWHGCRIRSASATAFSPVFFFLTGLASLRTLLWPRIDECSCCCMKQSTNALASMHSPSASAGLEAGVFLASELDLDILDLVSCVSWFPYCSRAGSILTRHVWLSGASRPLRVVCLLFCLWVIFFVFSLGLCQLKVKFCLQEG